MLSDEVIDSSSALYDMLYQEDTPLSNNNNTSPSITRVLITRTVSPSEIPIVIEDLIHVKSFYTGNNKHPEELYQKSIQYCNTLRTAGYAASLDPYVNGSQSYPNHILCDSSKSSSSSSTSNNNIDNNYISVQADFMLFARSEAHAQNISNTIEQLSQQYELDKTTPYHKVNVDIRDVSQNPKKIWNWIVHATEERLIGYDYIWFMDGDISLKSLNWQAFWQQVKILRPKITQAGTIGRSKDGHATVHGILRHKSDSRLVAAAVPILEVQSPLLEVDTWIGYRNFLANDPEPMEQFEVGGEQCFDMAWCHYAMNKLEGQQQNGKISVVGYHDWSPTLDLSGKDPNQQGRGCVVLYQTPIVHISKYTIVTSGRFQIASLLLCRYFRLKLGAVGKQGLKTVYDVFNYPKPSYAK